MPRDELTPEKLQALERRRNVAALRLRGLTQWEIARWLGINQSNVSRHLAAAEKEWMAAAVADVAAIKARELARIDQIERQAWRGWSRSLRDAEKRTAGSTATGTVDTTVTEGQAGDPRFLLAVDACIDRRLKIVGGYPRDDGPPAPAVVVIQKFAPGVSPADLLGGRLSDANGHAGTTAD